eukprot:4235217-Amphidinium_carterae.1
MPTGELVRLCQTNYCTAGNTSGESVYEPKFRAPIPASETDETIERLREDLGNARTENHELRSLLQMMGMELTEERESRGGCREERDLLKRELSQSYSFLNQSLQDTAELKEEMARLRVQRDLALERISLQERQISSQTPRWQQAEIYGRQGKPDATNVDSQHLMMLAFLLWVIVAVSVQIVLQCNGQLRGRVFQSRPQEASEFTACLGTQQRS